MPDLDIPDSLSDRLAETMVDHAETVVDHAKDAAIDIAVPVAKFAFFGVLGRHRRLVAGMVVTGAGLVALLWAIRSRSAGPTDDERPSSSSDKLADVSNIDDHASAMS